MMEDKMEEKKEEEKMEDEKMMMMDAEWIERNMILLCLFKQIIKVISKISVCSKNLP